jgi:hypothetical protein
MAKHEPNRFSGKP